MKQQENIRLLPLYIISLLFLFIISSCSATKQPIEVIGASAPEVEEAIKSDKWIFIANQAMPQRGRSQMLTTRYSVLCNKDTLISALPYFGRAYTAPIGENTSPLNFKSTGFSFTRKEVGNGKWNITIKPNDYRDVQSYIFTLFSNGSAQLGVQLTNRSTISFSGTVMPVK